MKIAGKLAGDSATPLYQQVANDLREAIVNDVYHVCLLYTSRCV